LDAYDALQNLLTLVKFGEGVFDQLAVHIGVEVHLVLAKCDVSEAVVGPFAELLEDAVLHCLVEGRGAVRGLHGHACVRQLVGGAFHHEQELSVFLEQS